MEQNCLEQILKEVVQIDLVLASRCNIPEPFFKPGIVKMPGSVTTGNDTTDIIGEPSLTVKYNVDTDTTEEIDEAPTLVQKETASLVGTIVTHDLKVPLAEGSDDLRAATEELRHTDFHILLTTADAERYLCYAVPNTSAVSLLDDTMGEVSSVKLQATLQSMSHVIRLE